MHQCIVIGPTADAVEPGLEHLELAVAEFGVELLQHKDGSNFFFKHRAGEKMVGDLDQKVEPAFLLHFATEADGRGASLPYTIRAI